MSGYAPYGVQLAFTRRSGRRALVVHGGVTLRELLDDLRAEGVEVAGVAARHQPLVGDDLLVDPLGPRVGQVRLQARVRGQRPALDNAGVDQRPRAVADDAHGLAGPEDLLHEAA